MTNLPPATKSANLSRPGRDVWMIEAIPCSAGDEFDLAFESSDDRWRHGVWMAVDGGLEVGLTRSPQVVLWRDNTPGVIRVRVVDSTDGLLRLYNIWDSGRGIRPHESQSHTSGMLREQTAIGTRYRCSDIDPDPSFEALVFSIAPVIDQN